MNEGNVKLNNVKLAEHVRDIKLQFMYFMVFRLMNIMQKLWEYIGATVALCSWFFYISYLDSVFVMVNLTQPPSPCVPIVVLYSQCCFEGMHNIYEEKNCGTVPIKRCLFCQRKTFVHWISIISIIELWFIDFQSAKFSVIKKVLETENIYSE